jgi:hypothetical protein
MDGSGPETPGANDAVQLEIRINGNSSAATDQNAALATGGIGMEVDGAGTAEFANLSVAHH